MQTYQRAGHSARTLWRVRVGVGDADALSLPKARTVLDDPLTLSGGEPYSKQFLVSDGKGDSWRTGIRIVPCAD